MTTQEFIEIVKTRIEILQKEEDDFEREGSFRTAYNMTHRIEELQSLIEYLENPRIK